MKAAQHARLCRVEGIALDSIDKIAASKKMAVVKTY